MVVQRISIANRVMQMYDFPFAIHSYSDGSEAHVRALIQASDEGHISVLADLLFHIGGRNPSRAFRLYGCDLLRFRLRLFAIRNKGEIIGLETRDCLSIAAIVRVHPLLFDTLQTCVIGCLTL